MTSKMFDVPCRFFQLQAFTVSKELKVFFGDLKTSA